MSDEGFDLYRCAKGHVSCRRAAPVGPPFPNAVTFATELPHPPTLTLFDNPTPLCMACVGEWAAANFATFRWDR